VGWRIDLSGEVFGRLTVIEEHPERRWSQAVWRCRCECGADVVALSHLLRSGQTQSCGCLRVETTKARFAELRALRGEEQEAHFRRRQRRRREQRDGKSPNRGGVWKRDSANGETALCHLCQKIVHRSDPWIMEHLIPLWAEGRDSYANVAVACAPCAKAKTATELTQRARRDADLRKLAEAWPVSAASLRLESRADDQ
jgi:5-methylcytosine-specific restriction endonuclease McrA